jgi:chromosome segregation ATPase
MLSSSKPDKSEAKFTQRLDVLAERVDTLAQTVATTASSMAKKDGEIAALRKELDARDERLADFITKAREATGGSELRELKEAVAALAKDRSKGGGASTKHLDDLASKVALLGQRLETLSTTVSTTAAGLSGREGEIAAIRKQLESGQLSGAAVAAPDPALIQRVGDLAADVSGTRQNMDGLTADVAALRSIVEQRSTEPQRPSEEVLQMLVALRAKVEELAGFRAGVNEEQLEQRLAGADESMSLLSGRVDVLTTTFESAVASLAGKEHELEALHRHVTESSTRIESVAGDIRDALAAFSELGPTNERDLTTLVEQLVSRVEKIETATREASAAREQSVGDVGQRIDLVDQRVAAVAAEVARAKTLWPVALRSLEARLDDVASHPRRVEAVPAPVDDESDGAADGAADASADDDLLAGLRDSLQAMESVAAEMARASDVLGAGDEPDEPEESAVAAGGATVVPLRSSDG